MATTEQIELGSGDCDRTDRSPVVATTEQIELGSGDGDITDRSPVVATTVARAAGGGGLGGRRVALIPCKNP